MDAAGNEAVEGVGDGGKTSKDVAADTGGWGDGSPSALAYDSEEERMEALAPKTDAQIIMEQRKQKAQKMIAKKPGTTLNPRKVQH